MKGCNAYGPLCFAFKLPIVKFSASVCTFCFYDLACAVIENTMDICGEGSTLFKKITYGEGGEFVFVI